MIRRFIKADMAVMSDAQKLKVLLPCLMEDLIIRFTGLLAVCLSAVRKKGFFGTDIYMGKKGFLSCNRHSSGDLLYPVLCIRPGSR